MIQQRKEQLLTLISTPGTGAVDPNRLQRRTAQLLSATPEKLVCARKYLRADSAASNASHDAAATEHNRVDQLNVLTVLWDGSSLAFAHCHRGTELQFCQALVAPNDLHVTLELCRLRLADYAIDDVQCIVTSAANYEQIRFVGALQAMFARSDTIELLCMKSTKFSAKVSLSE